MIADANGEVPAALRNDKDWEQYQAALAASDLVVFARISHENEPNTHGDPRMVMSRDAKGWSSAPDAWWWNPADVRLGRGRCAQVLPDGGEVAAPGGQGVFDLFLGIGYDVFHLARARGVKLPGGRRCSRNATSGVSAEAVLERHGLRHAETHATRPGEGRRDEHLAGRSPRPDALHRDLCALSPSFGPLALGAGGDHRHDAGDHAGAFPVFALLGGDADDADAGVVRRPSRTPCPRPSRPAPPSRNRRTLRPCR